MNGVRIVSFGAFLLTSTINGCVAQGQPVTILSSGGNQCGEYVAAPAASKAIYLAWTVGFLSGANWEDSAERRSIGEGWKSDSIMLWLDGFCQRRPLSLFATGAECLREALAEEQGIRSQKPAPTICN